MNTDNRYAQWFGRVVWLGIAANMLFVIPLLFFPEALLNLLHMRVPDPIVWVQGSGLLLLEISILYIPPAMEIVAEIDGVLFGGGILVAENLDAHEADHAGDFVAVAEQLLEGLDRDLVGLRVHGRTFPLRGPAEVEVPLQRGLALQQGS